MKTAIAFFLMLAASIVVPDLYACDCQDEDQWHHALIHSDWAWGTTTGSDNVIIAVIGSGIDLDGYELDGNLWTNPGETASNSTDDDGNGFVDDIHGWDFQSNQADVNDYGGCGTVMATIAAAEGPTWNFRGMGVTHNASIMSLRTATCGAAGDIAWEISALRYARNKGAKVVITNSVHGTYSSAYDAALDSCTTAGMLIFVTSGDEAGVGIDDCTQCNPWPSRYTDACIVSVAGSGYSTVSGEVRQTSSNWGPISVDLYAPRAHTAGGTIWTTGLNNQWGNTTYGAAQSLVAGAAALLWAAEPNATAAQVKAAILNNVVTDQQYNGYCVSGGRLDVDAAMNDLTGGEIESTTPTPVAEIAAPTIIDDGKLYDVMGRRVGPGYRGVAFTKSRKRVVVMP